jgi:hypothetical protein
MAAAAWALARAQHGVITRAQLLELGYSADAIRHRLETGRLHEVHRGVYAVGRAQLSQLGRWMAAVLAGGEGALLSHHSQAEHLGFRPRLALPIEVTIRRVLVARGRASASIARVSIQGTSSTAMGFPACPS